MTQPALLSQEAAMRKLIARLLAAWMEGGCTCDSRQGRKSCVCRK